MKIFGKYLFRVDWMAGLLLSIVGSTREQSFNRELAKVAEEMLKGKCNVKRLDY